MSSLRGRDVPAPKETGSSPVRSAASVRFGSTIENSGLDSLTITDSIPLSEEKKSYKINVVSISTIIANAIRSLENGESLQL